MALAAYKYSLMDWRGFQANLKETLAKVAKDVPAKSSFGKSREQLNPCW